MNKVYDFLKTYPNVAIIDMLFLLSANATPPPLALLELLWDSSSSITIINKEVDIKPQRTGPCSVIGFHPFLTAFLRLVVGD